MSTKRYTVRYILINNEPYITRKVSKFGTNAADIEKSFAEHMKEAYKILEIEIEDED